MVIRVLIVDDDLEDAEVVGRRIAQEGHIEIEYATLEQLTELSDYDRLLTGEFDAFIVDHRLFDTGKVSYSGLELSRHLRSRVPELAIYLATNFADEVRDEDLSREVDEVVEKEALHQKSYRDAIRARLLRSARQFLVAMDEKVRRIDQLIGKKVDSTLTAEEAEELRRLQDEIEKPSQRVKQARRKKLEEYALLEDRLEDLLHRAEKLLEEDD